MEKSLKESICLNHYKSINVGLREGSMQRSDKNLIVGKCLVMKNYVYKVKNFEISSESYKNIQNDFKERKQLIFTF